MKSRTNRRGPQGFVYASNDRHVDSEEPFPSLDINAIRNQASRSEVATAIHLPLKAFASPSRIRSSLFRASAPYWAVDVTDIVRSVITEHAVTSKLGEEGFRDEVGAGVDGRIEVWGLTGWYLSLLMKALQVYR